MADMNRSSSRPSSLLVSFRSMSPLLALVALATPSRNYTLPLIRRRVPLSQLKKISLISVTRVRDFAEIITE
jgi:hypothetical protein